MADRPDDPPKDALGLDLNSLTIADPHPPQTADSQQTEEPQATSAADAQSPANQNEAQEPPATVTDADPKSPTAAPREKKKPYVNPERVKTGGAPRVRIRPAGPQHRIC